MAFRGWPPAAVEFYEGLEADNSKAYWQAHKGVYDEHVRGPMEELLAELAAEFGEGRIFRPYRDVRFSADKSPYKTAIAATLTSGGYVQLSADGLAAARGTYAMAPDQLERYRRAVAGEPSGTQLGAIVEVLRADGIDVVAQSELKTAPRGYPRDHVRADLLRRKGLASWREWPVGEELATAAPLGWVVGVLRASAPLADWLERYVGAGEHQDGRRR